MTDGGSFYSIDDVVVKRRKRRRFLSDRRWAQAGFESEGVSEL